MSAYEHAFLSARTDGGSILLYVGNAERYMSPQEAKGLARMFNTLANDMLRRQALRESLKVSSK